MENLVNLLAQIKLVDVTFTLVVICAHGLAHVHHLLVDRALLVYLCVLLLQHAPFGWICLVHLSPWSLLGHPECLLINVCLATCLSRLPSHNFQLRIFIFLHDSENLLPFGILPLVIEALDFCMMHLIHLFDRAVKTRWPLRDQERLSRGTPSLELNRIVQQSRMGCCIHVMNELLLQALLGSQVAPRERMVVENVDDEPPIVSKYRNVPAHERHLAVVEDLQLLV